MAGLACYRVRFGKQLPLVSQLFLKCPQSRLNSYTESTFLRHCWTAGTQYQYTVDELVLLIAHGSSVGLTLLREKRGRGTHEAWMARIAHRLLHHLRLSPEAILSAAVYNHAHFGFAWRWLVDLLLLTQQHLNTRLGCLGESSSSANSLRDTNHRTPSQPAGIMDNIKVGIRVRPLLPR